MEKGVSELSTRATSGASASWRLSVALVASTEEREDSPFEFLCVW